MGRFCNLQTVFLIKENYTSVFHYHCHKIKWRICEIFEVPSVQEQQQSQHLRRQTSKPGKDLASLVSIPYRGTLWRRYCTALENQVNMYCNMYDRITESYTTPIYANLCLVRLNTALFWDYLKCELRVTSCKLRVTSILLISNNIGFNFNPGLTLT